MEGQPSLEMQDRVVTDLALLKITALEAVKQGLDQTEDFKKREPLFHKLAFLGALVAMGLLRRTRAGRYANTRRAALYLDRTRPTYIGGLIELSSTRCERSTSTVWPSWK